MRSLRFGVLLLGLLGRHEIAETAEATEVVTLTQRSDPSREHRRPPPRTIGRLGVGVQLGGFYDLGDPGLELRGWARGLGFSIGLGRHTADPSEPGFTEVSSEAGEQVSGGALFAFVNPKAGHRVPIKIYGTAGVVHTTQARGRWERIPPGPDGTTGEAGVEGTTGTWPYVGAGAEIGFAKLPGLAVGGELIFAIGGEGFGPGIRFGVRYYVW